MAKYKKKLRKDYMRMFVRLCRDHKVLFSIDNEGCVSSLVFLGCYEGDRYAPDGLKFGSKAAYKWLEQMIREENAND